MDSVTNIFSAGVRADRKRRKTKRPNAKKNKFQIAREQAIKSKNETFEYNGMTYVKIKTVQKKGVEMYKDKKGTMRILRFPIYIKS